MQTETTCNDNQRTNQLKQPMRILIGYNLPFILWTGMAIYQAISRINGLWPCPVRTVFGWCPSCGLTGAYADLLSGRGFHNGWLIIVLNGFFINAIRSVAKAIRC